MKRLPPTYDLPLGHYIPRSHYLSECSRTVSPAVPKYSAQMLHRYRNRKHAYPHQQCPEAAATVPPCSDNHHFSSPLVVGSGGSAVISFPDHIRSLLSLPRRFSL